MGRAAALRHEIEELGIPQRRPRDKAERVMWHVTASRLRDSIQMHGIDARRFKQPGSSKVKEHFNYLWSDFEAALAYVEWLREEEPDGIDIWEARTHGLVLDLDPYFDGRSGLIEFIGEDGDYAAWRSKMPISSALLTLSRQDL